MIGKTLAHYEITGKLGSGGMGDVFRARDTKLDREVALKILPKDMAQDPDRRMRFEREAKAVAALNHPNIVTIHAVEEIDGHHFIAMELVAGEPLTEIISRGALSLSRILDIAVPLTEAMTAAHAKGITHRDLKPANIMVAEDGQVKVLDFGLAKLLEGSEPSQNMTIAADTATQEGRILGTVAYMSPEQAEGKPVGPESDVFSLGVVLFEMATGQRPFQGDTAISTLSAILREDPPSVTELKTDLPRHLGRIIKRCLAKAPDRRYQSARDLRNELLELKEDVTSGELSITGSDVQAAAVVLQASWPKRLILGAAGLALIVAGYFLVSRLTGTADSPQAVAQGGGSMEVTRLTSTGKSTEAAISPEGRYVAHVIREAGTWRLMVTHVSTMSSVEVVSRAKNYIWDPAFSPDGDFIYYCQRDEDAIESALYRVPVLGGSPTRILTDLNSTVSFSPDGSQIAFGRDDQANLSAQIIIADVDGSNQRVLASQGFPDPINEGPAWSPDGKLVAAPMFSLKKSIEASIVGFDVESGEKSVIFPPKEWMQINEIVWHPDGRSLVFNGNEGLVSSQLFEVFVPSGELRRITNDVNQYNGVGITADGSTLVAGIDETNFNVWVTGLVGDNEPRQITKMLKGSYAVDAWTSEWLIITSDAEGAQIWKLKPDGSQATRLTSGHLNFLPSVTPDHGSMLFTSTRGGGINLWRMDLDGGTPQQVSTDQLETEVQVSPDGEWIVYMAGGVTQSIYKRPLQGGDPVQLISGTAANPRISPDGKQLAYHAYSPEDGKGMTFIMPFEGGEPVGRFDIPGNFQEWAPDGSAITYIENEDGVGNIWNQPLDGGDPVQLTFFDNLLISSFVWSPDGTQLAVSRGTSSSDVILIKNFR